MKFIKIQTTIFNVKSILYIVQEGKSILVQTEKEVCAFVYKNSEEAKIMLEALWLEFSLKGA